MANQNCDIVLNRNTNRINSFMLAYSGIGSIMILSSRKPLGCQLGNFIRIALCAAAGWNATPSICQELPYKVLNPAADKSTPLKPNIMITSAPPTPQPAPSLPSDEARFIRERQPSNILSWTNDGDHEDAGVLTDGGGGFTGVLALHAVYQTGTLQLSLPQNATRTQTLFAPTTRAPNGSCLEVGTKYETQIGQPTTATLYVFDFCKPTPQFVLWKPIDSNFISTYAGGSLQGQHAYSLAIFTTDAAVSLTSAWSSLLYNYQTKKFDSLWTSTGAYTYDPRGWSIFETWYQQGQCSEALPRLGATGLAYFNPSTKKWEGLAPTMPGLTNYVHSGGNCFLANHDEGPSYQIVSAPTYNSWTVTSTGQ
jgi:hypothetical protein